jgi:endonuclease YncB( thermonuclease family)
MGCKYSKEPVLQNATFENIPTFTLNGLNTNVKILNVYNGDTLWAALEHNTKICKYKIRMLEYDSPELHPLKSTPNRGTEISAAKEAKEYLEGLVLNKIVSAEFYDFDKYGRPLCKLYIPDPKKSILNVSSPNKVCVNTLMIRNGHGYQYMGGTKKSFSTLNTRS